MQKVYLTGKMVILFANLVNHVKKGIGCLQSIDVLFVLFLGKSFPEYQPSWFRKAKDPTTGNLIHLFTNEYWECKERQDFGRCPDIF